MISSSCSINHSAFFRPLQIQRTSNFILHKKINFRFQTNVVRNSNSNSLPILSITTNDSGTKAILSSVICPHFNDRPFAYIDLPCSKKDRHLKIIGHSHGIVCFNDAFYKHNDIFLSNPKTGEVHQLPPSILLLQARSGRSEAIGFGYDHKAKDFKVVRVVSFEYSKGFYSRIEVYDLSTDRWREILSHVIRGGLTFGNQGFFVPGGFYYWFSDHFLLSFDMSEEVFRKIPVPRCLKYLNDQITNMGVWNGSIVLFCTLDKYRNDTRIGFWVMEKYESGEVTWSKLSTIRLPDTLDKYRNDRVKEALLFANTDEVLIELLSGQVISYNINTKTVKKLMVEAEGIPRSVQGSVFEESLLSIKGGIRLGLGAQS